MTVSGGGWFLESTLFPRMKTLKGKKKKGTTAFDDARPDQKE